jgi:hypothetical protein
METMRQLFTLTAALVLFSGLLGCHCTTGACDCDPGTGPCCYGPSPVAPIAVTSNMLPGESMSPPMARVDR